MQTQRVYGGAIWTNKAQEQMQQRNIPQELASSTFNRPEHSLDGRTPGTFEYKKKFDEHEVSVVATKTDRGEWLIISVYVHPPFPTASYPQKVAGESWLDKFLRSIFSAFGL